MDSSVTSWLRTRHCGVLAHVSSLPGEYGIGNLGAGARAFVDLLAGVGAGYWQMCPLGPTGYGDSPYQSFSSFAGNPYFIDWSELQAAKLISADELAPLRALAEGAADYGGLYHHFWPCARLAHARFIERGRQVAGWGDYEAFCLRAGAWLQPYAAFMALKERFGGRPWPDWPVEFRDSGHLAGGDLPGGTAREAELHVFLQWIFARQWQALRSYARSREVRLIGDVPIFVALDSADTWSRREVFRLTPEGRLIAAAGVPPDYFSDCGQYWGNPLYDWDHLARTDYAWWIERLRAAFASYDVVRLDHFRGFDTFWEIPGDTTDARCGRWVEGPGQPFFDRLRQALPGARIIAEDLGYVTPGVVRLRRRAGLPGMKILQFGYHHDDNNVNLPHFHPADAVVYPGTHDNDTTRGWLESLPPEAYAEVDAYFQLAGGRSAWPLIRAAMASPARLTVIPLQDLLDLPSSARLNRPGIADGNWTWRCTPAQAALLGGEPAARFRRLAKLYDRDGDPRQRDYSAPPGSVSSHVDDDATLAARPSPASAQVTP
jgi:4-alpha-glucanotransferase